MIKFFQRHHYIRNIIYSIVVFTFVGAGFLGWGSYNFKNNNIIDTVYEKDITKQEVDRVINNLLALKYHFLNNSKGRKTLEEIKNKQYNDLYKEAIELLKFKYKTLYFSDKKLFLSVSDKEVFEYLSKIPYFQTDFSFDKKKYFEFLRRINSKPSEFEDRLREDLLLKKSNIFFDKGFNTSFDLDFLYSFSKISKEIVISITDVSDINISGDSNISISDLKSYYNSNINDFKKEDFIIVDKYTFNIDNNESNEDFKKRVLKNKILLKKHKDKYMVYSSLDSNISIKKGNLLSFYRRNNNLLVSKPEFKKNSAFIYVLNGKSFDKFFSFEEVKNKIEQILNKKNSIKKFIKNEFRNDIENGSNYIGNINPYIQNKNLENLFENTDIKKKVSLYIFNSNKIEDVFLQDNFIIHYKIIDITLEEELNQEFLKNIKEKYKIFQFKYKSNSYIDKHI